MRYNSHVIKEIEMKKRTLLVLVGLLCLSFSFSCGLAELRQANKTIDDLEAKNAQLKEENAVLNEVIVDLEEDNLTPAEKASRLYQRALGELKKSEIRNAWTKEKDFYGNRIYAFHSLTKAIQYDPVAEYYYLRGTIRNSKEAETVNYMWGDALFSVTPSEIRATTNPDQWLEDLSEAVLLEPSNPRYRLERAVTYHEIGDEEKATIDFEAVIRLAQEQNMSDSQVSEYYVIMGMAYYTVYAKGYSDRDPKDEANRRTCIEYLTKARDIKKLPVDSETIENFVQQMNQLSKKERKKHFEKYPDDQTFYDLIRVITSSESYRDEIQTPLFLKNGPAR